MTKLRHALPFAVQSSALLLKSERPCLEALGDPKAHASPLIQHNKGKASKRAKSAVEAVRGEVLPESIPAALDDA
jgi:hypothetical protein